MEVLEFKNTIIELKTSNGRLKSKMERTEKRISELGDRIIEMTQSEQQREKTLKIDCRTITKDLTFLFLESQKEKRKNGAEKVLKMAETLSNLTKDINLQTQKVE